MINQNSPNFDYSSWLKSSITAYELLAKSLVAHRAEKGRIVEGVVKTVLRSILPQRFSIGTGFAITSTGKMSRQLDLVIYDAEQNVPIMLEGGTGLFPIECVYATVEVKSNIASPDLEPICASIGQIRNMALEKRYVEYGTRGAEQGKPVVDPRPRTSTLPPRAFVFATRTAYGTLGNLYTALKSSTERHGAHIHGLLVVDKDWLIVQKAAYNMFVHEFSWTEQAAFSEFYLKILDDVQSFKMGPAWMRPYLHPDADQCREAIQGRETHSLVGSVVGVTGGI